MDRIQDVSNPPDAAMNRRHCPSRVQKKWLTFNKMDRHPMITMFTFLMLFTKAFSEDLNSDAAA